MREGGTSVRIDALTAGYGGVEVLRAVSLVIDPGELVTLLGPSGCGKSTLLRAIAGLHPLEAGGISFNERPVDRLPPEKRRIAMVFQRPLLFPWLNVAENVRFGLRMRRVPDFVARQRVGEALRL
ncbi:MAG: ATP-binding cassette domain-containing protein, partial [Blastocatellia bacterium]